MFLMFLISKEKDPPPAKTQNFSARKMLYFATSAHNYGRVLGCESPMEK